MEILRIGLRFTSTTETFRHSGVFYNNLQADLNGFSKNHISDLIGDTGLKCLEFLDTFFAELLAGLANGAARVTIETYPLWRIKVDAS